MKQIPCSRQTGFILSIVERSTRWWTEYLEIWSWVPVFHCHKRRSEDASDELQQNNYAHDIAWIGMPLLASFFLWCGQRPWNGLSLLGITVMSWRAFSLFVQSLRLPLFGWESPVGVPEHMSIHRAQRRILLVILYITELVIVYAVIYLALSQYFGVPFDKSISRVGQALQLSFATLSTVGYGTYAPVSVIGCVVAFMETLTGLLFVTATIATLAALLKAEQSAQQHPEVEEEDSASGGEGGFKVDGRTIALRMWLPPIATLSILLALFCVCVVATPMVSIRDSDVLISLAVLVVALVASGVYSLICWCRFKRVYLR